MAYNRWAGLGEAIGSGVGNYLNQKQMANPESLQNKVLQQQLALQALAPFRAYQSLSNQDKAAFNQFNLQGQQGGGLGSLLNMLGAAFGNSYNPQPQPSAQPSSVPPVQNQSSLVYAESPADEFEAIQRGYKQVGTTKDGKKVYEVK